jgi:hypothetical protein
MKSGVMISEERFSSPGMSTCLLEDLLMPPLRVVRQDHPSIRRCHDGDPGCQALQHPLYWATRWMELLSVSAKAARGPAGNMPSRDLRTARRRAL